MSGLEAPSQAQIQILGSSLESEQATHTLGPHGSSAVLSSFKPIQTKTTRVKTAGAGGNSRGAAAKALSTANSKVGYQEIVKRRKNAANQSHDSRFFMPKSHAPDTQYIQGINATHEFNIFRESLESNGSLNRNRNQQSIISNDQEHQRQIEKLQRQFQSSTNSLYLKPRNRSRRNAKHLRTTTAAATLTKCPKSPYSS